MLDARLAAPFTADANDVLYQWDSSRDYNPSPGLEKIKATVLAINAADDERNPPELGILDREMKRVKNGRILLIPAGDDTAGHGTTGRARLYKRELGKLMQARRGFNRRAHGAQYPGRSRPRRPADHAGPGEIRRRPSLARLERRGGPRGASHFPQLGGLRGGRGEA